MDRVLPDVGLRQWVVTFPWPRRWLLARRPDLARGVLAVAIRTVAHFVTRRAPALVVELVTRSERWLSRQGFGADDALPLMQAASVQERSAVSGGRPARRFQVHRGRVYALPRRCAGWGGYTLHGGVTVGGRDAGGRERLCRYLARPALARTRLRETPAGLIRVTFKRPWADGTAGVTFTPLEFVERLAALVPPPRAHLVQTLGVLAGRSALRREVVPAPPVSPSQRQALSNKATPGRNSRCLTWAELLWRVFAVGGWRCPHCGGPMTLRAVPWPRATLRILDGLDTSAARAPPDAVAIPA